MASELLSFGILSLCVGKCVKIAAALYLLSRVYHKYMAVWRSLESAYDYRTDNAGICFAPDHDSSPVYDCSIILGCHVNLVLVVWSYLWQPSPCHRRNFGYGTRSRS
jgi:hypothetical protein